MKSGVTVVVELFEFLLFLFEDGDDKDFEFGNLIHFKEETDSSFSKLIVEFKESSCCCCCCCEGESRCCMEMLFVPGREMEDARSMFEGEGNAVIREFIRV